MDKEYVYAFDLYVLFHIQLILQMFSHTIQLHIT